MRLAFAADALHTKQTQCMCRVFRHKWPNDINSNWLITSHALDHCAWYFPGHKGPVITHRELKKKQWNSLSAEEHRRLKMICKCNLTFNEALLTCCMAFSYSKACLDCACVIIGVQGNCKAMTMEVKGSGILSYQKCFLSIHLFHLKCI